MRISKNKEQIVHILNLIQKPINVNEIYNILSKTCDVNLSTVYRCVNKLCDENVLSKEIREDKNAYYFLNSNVHKHNLVCDLCKKDILIDLCPIKKLSDDIMKQTGFYVTKHSLQISGICKNCSNKLYKKS